MSGKKGGAISRTYAASGGSRKGGTPPPQPQPPAPKGPPPARKITWTPPKTVEFGQPADISTMGASATGAGGKLYLEYPQGPFRVGQPGNNLRVVAPGDGTASSTGSETVTVTVTPAPRTISYTPLGKPVLLNAPLTPGMFAAVPSAGEGAVTMATPSGGTAASHPTQRVVLKLAAAGNHAAAPDAAFDIDVELPERDFAWTPPAGIPYLTTLTPKVLGCNEASAVLSPLASDPPGAGSLEVTITVPGDGATCRDGVKKRTVQITPLARAPVIANKLAVIRLGDTLTAATFGATASVGATAPIVTSPAGPLTQVERALSITIGFAPDPNFTDTPETFQAIVAKGKATLTWTTSPDAVVKNTKLAKALLNAQIAPAPLAATDIEYDPPAGSDLKTAGLQLLMATHPGNASYLPSGPATVRLTVCDSESAAKGANLMKADPDQVWKNKPGTPKFAEWDATDSALKKSAIDVMDNIKATDMAGMRRYLNGITDVETRSQPGTFPEEIWRLPSGVQVRLKPQGSENSNGKPEFMVEVLKDGTKISSKPGDIAFKVTLDGKPSPKTPGEVQIPPGQGTLPSGKTANEEMFASGAMTCNHLRPLEQPPPKLLEWDLAQNAEFVRGGELFDVVPRAIADVEVTYRSSTVKKDLKYGDACKVMLGDAQFTVSAVARGYKTEKRVLRIVAKR